MLLLMRLYHHRLRLAGFLALAGLLLGLAGCASPGPTPDATRTIDAFSTQVVETVIADMTATAALLPTATPLPANTLLAPSALPGEGGDPGGEGEGGSRGEGNSSPPTLSPTEIYLTLQPELPTNTPAPTLPPEPSPTPAPTPTPSSSCNWAQFVVETGPARAAYEPGERFLYSWRIRNIGACTWTPQYRLVFITPFASQGMVEIFMPAFVAPGQTVDLSANLVAPSASGNYQSYWYLMSPEGETFGVGDPPSSPHWLLQRVLEVDPDGSPFNFALNYCSAEWRTANGYLTCPGESDEPAGFVVLLDKPELENRNEDEPALWTQPNQRSSGWISGTYPPVRIRDGDRFVAWLGCLADAPGCDVIFQLDYQAGAQAVRSLGQWHEEMDGAITRLDIDLSDLAGEWVQFTFSVMVNNREPEDASAFWFNPHIER